MTNFRESVEKGLGAAVIFAGSDSDLPHVKKITDSLDRYGIPHEIRIASAHKQPERLSAIIRDYDSIPGLLAYVAVAGGTDALSGTLSWPTPRPVISCPPDGIANTTCLTNPPGSSNATIYHPNNVGRFIAQMFSYANPEYAKIIKAHIDDKLTALEKADLKARGEE